MSAKYIKMNHHCMFFINLCHIKHRDIYMTSEIVANEIGEHAQLSIVLNVMQIDESNVHHSSIFYSTT